MNIAHGRPRTAARLGATAVVTFGLALSAAGCKHESDTATDDAGPAAEPSSVTSTAAARDYPDYAPEDYTYRLEVLCYCPQVGAVRITVRDGEVASAKAVTGKAKGTDAPEFVRLTINDIIERANDPSVDKADVTWPAGQDHPSVVALDQLTNATDDEVTYTIKNVTVSEE